MRMTCLFTGSTHCSGCYEKAVWKSVVNHNVTYWCDRCRMALGKARLFSHSHLYDEVPEWSAFSEEDQRREIEASRKRYQESAERRERSTMRRRIKAFAEYSGISLTPKRRYDPVQATTSPPVAIPRVLMARRNFKFNAEDVFHPRRTLWDACVERLAVL